MGFPEWKGEAIAGLSLHRPVILIARLDFLPFVALYLGWTVICVTNEISQLFEVLGAVVLVVLHLLVFLMQYWSLSVRVLVGHRTLTSVGEKDEAEISEGKIKVRAIPPPHRGKADFTTLQIDDRKIHFSFQMLTYEYNRETGYFEELLPPDNLPLKHYVEYARKAGGLDEESVFRVMRRFGTNRIEIPLPKFWDLYQEQLLSPFFVFQVFCILLWVLDAYWQYFAMTLVMMLIFEATVVKGRLRSLAELRGMRNKPSRINAYRSKKWVSISSLELLPGDIISLTRGSTPDVVVPCDCLILSGGAVVNESMLTGESVPLMKEGIAPLPDRDADRDLRVNSEDKAHILFGGTRILTHTSATISDSTPTSKAPDNGCVCFVLRTGYSSAQGVLLRTILASTEKVSADSWEAAFFILFLLVFALVASGYVLVKGMEDEDRDHYKLLLHCILIITSVIPPQLPMQLALAVNSSLLALAQELVFCTEPFRIPLAGKIDVCCFDKTGTLTTDNIKAAGVALPPVGEDPAAADEYPLVKPTEASFNASCVLAGCHSLVFVDDELVGDPLELAALLGVEWAYSKSEAAFPRKGSSGNGLKILNRFRFSSSLQRMSTIVEVQEGGTTFRPRGLVKGSPEAVGKLLGGPLPSLYDATALRLARQGLRVLALAYKDLDPTKTPSELKATTREELERDLVFAGFVAFECPLRGDSRKVVKNLRRSSHKVVMITGDAVLTAVHVAKEVSMVGKRTLILEKEKEELQWSSARTGDRHSLFNVAEVRNLSQTYDLAVPGFVFDGTTVSDEARNALALHATVFARMTPENKERVLTELKDQGFATLMCGDGTNDVGALKQSHVGVALLSVIAPAGAQHTHGTKQQRPQLQRNANTAQVVRKTKAKTGEKPMTKKKPAAGSQTKQADATSSVNGGVSNPKKAPAPPPEPEEDLSHLTPEQRRQRELKKRLEAQLKELDEMMGEDGPKLVKLGDASIASPFTSKKMSIESCAVIIRQGRCTLATTLQMYQVLALECLTSAYGLSVLYIDGVKFGDRQMTLSGLAIAGAFFLVTRAKPLEKLSSQRPATTVFHPSLFLSLLAQFAVHLVCLAMCVSVAKQYLPMDFDPDVDGAFQPNVLNTIVFLISTAQQVVVFAVNYKGYPFMQGLQDNKMLRDTLIVNFGVVLLLALEIVPELNEFAELVKMPAAWLRYETVKW
eukprot:CAMPEP_0184746042 /NCGR_PEP_ID=MMETSP0315-20130426/8616_1 /TAXON_ID=101924 /ORGANISM="Rhodosorus marinus, Strain UTEX LB 2760" /LENGTH=1197 /DNA_ID=CAMNT_0027218425 /DNA_START=56 /DNA_END=3646 /DNA_ORIENTATION=-